MEREGKESVAVRFAKEHLTAVLKDDIRVGVEHPQVGGAVELKRSAEWWLEPPAIIMEDRVVDKPVWEIAACPRRKYGQAISPEIHSVPDFDEECSGNFGENIERQIPANEAELYEEGTLIALFRKKERRLVASAREEGKLTGKQTRIVVVGQYESSEKKISRWAVVTGLADQENVVVLPGPGGEKTYCSISVSSRKEDLVWIGLVDNYVYGKTINKDDLYFVLAADTANKGEVKLNPSISPLITRKVVEGLELYFKEQYPDLK